MKASEGVVLQRAGTPTLNGSEREEQLNPSRSSSFPAFAAFALVYIAGLECF